MNSLGQDAICEAIARFTSLDQDTTATQIIPYLNSLKTRAALEDYLPSLLGPGPDQEGFVQKVVASRFPTGVQSNAFPSLQVSNPRRGPARQSSDSNVARSQSTQPPKSSSPLSLASHQPRSASSMERQQPTQDWSRQFGSSGNVYVKDRGSDDVDSLTRKGKRLASTQTAPSGSLGRPGSATSGKAERRPKPETDFQPPTSGRNRTAAAAQSNLQHASKSASDLMVPLSKSSLEQLYHLDRILNSLKSQDCQAHEATAQACFCAARVHELPTSPLPNLCTYCGMIYCRLKLPLAPCPSCLKGDQAWANANFKARIVSHFEYQKEEVIEAQLMHHRQAEVRAQDEAEQVRQAEGAFPRLGGCGGAQKGSGVGQTAKSSYVTPLTGGMSIEERIRDGYRRLEIAGDEAKKQQQEAEKGSGAHRVLVIDSKGKAKMVTTTLSRTVKKEGKKPTPVQEGNMGTMKEIEAENQLTALMDEWDDGQRMARGLEAVLVIPFGNVRHRQLTTGFSRLEYIPGSVYEADG